MQSTNPRVSKKITLLGSHAVGKTSLSARFAEGKFPENYATQIGLKVDKKTIILDSRQLDLLIWDIASHDDPRHLPPYYLDGCHGYLFVIDLTRPATYQKLSQELKQVQQLMPGIPHLVVGNKLDLLDAKAKSKLERKLGDTLDAWVSAQTGHGVTEVFGSLARRLDGAA